MVRALLYIIFIFFLLFAGLVNLSGCAKEYSYEGGPVQDTLNDTIPLDTIPKKAINFPFCELCNESNETLLSTWGFKYDTFFLCGNITAALIAPDKQGFTFFGPSACSIDTGLVMTVYLGSPLDSDSSDITSHQVIFEYYDNTTLTDIFMTDHLGPFSLTIDSYEYATHIAKGRFSGNVPAKNGDVVTITDGKFQIQFK